MATNLHSSSVVCPSSAALVSGRWAKVGGMPSTMSASELSLLRLLLSCFSALRGCSTASSADEEAKPTLFLATQVKVPASSGKTSLMTRVARLESS